MTPIMWEEKPWRWPFTSVLLQALLLAGTCRVPVSVPVPNGVTALQSRLETSLISTMGLEGLIWGLQRAVIDTFAGRCSPPQCQT